MREVSTNLLTTNSTFHSFYPQLAGLQNLCCAAVFICLLLLPATRAAAAPPSLELPIRCTLGRDCFIQNYFDHDPGSGAYDYTCGKLTYNTHHGTDFRLRDLAAMRKKVEVVAAAPGIVVGVRDGEPDISIKFRGKEGLKGKDAGNGVRIDHGNGWTTQYSHLLLGSIRVRIGQQVKTGELLGMVGLSGNTEFPHLDFGVSKDGKPVDPFNPGSASCGIVSSTLWSASLAPQLRYQASGILISGFAAALPLREIAENGGYDQQSIAVDAENLVYWVQLFGLRKNDQLTLELFGPDRQPFSRNAMLLSGNKAVWFAFSGKKRKEAAWPKGTYKAVVRLERAGKIVLEERKEVEVK